MQNKRMSK